MKFYKPGFYTPSPLEPTPRIPAPGERSPIEARSWGARELLSTFFPPLPNQRAKSTFVDLRNVGRPRIFAIQYRFTTPTATGAIQDDNNWLPTSAGLFKVTIRRGIDEKGFQATDVFTGTASTLAQLPKFVMGYGLSIDVELLDVAAAIWVEVQACIVDYVDPMALIGATAGELGGFQTSVISRIAVNVAAVTLLFANIQRRQFFIYNNSFTSTLFFAYASTINIGAGTESFTAVLAPGATYESPIGGYTGRVEGIWNLADAAGEALVTELRVP